MLKSFTAKYNIGLINTLETNSGIDHFLPKEGSILTIPQQIMLPTTSRHGINGAEMRLYYYPKTSTTVVVFPISIGKIGKDTPLNWIASVYRKQEKPTRTKTNQIRKEYVNNGKMLPKVFSAGQDNPMGLYTLYDI